MSFINHIGTALPQYKHKQTDILNFMLGAADFSDDEARRLSLMYHRSGIAFRHSVIPDYDLPVEDRIFYPKSKDLEPFPTVDQRMEVYENEAVVLAVEAIKNTIPEIEYDFITHLITVSCTGMMAPGLDIQLVEALGLKTNVVRTSVNFMGCYAALHGLKLADAFCAGNAKAKVLVVCVELCTLHFQKKNTLDFQTSNLLFADGASACLVSNEATGHKIKGFYAELALQGKLDMVWRISQHGFLMTLTNHIPRLLEGGINSLLSSALSNFELSQEQINHWAIHPGGKSILEAIQKAVGINRADCWASYEVLNNCGNMSSATILFVLNELKNKTQLHENTFAVAFGPGLTMESMALECV